MVIPTTQALLLICSTLVSHRYNISDDGAAPVLSLHGWCGHRQAIAHMYPANCNCHISCFSTPLICSYCTHLLYFLRPNMELVLSASVSFSLCCPTGHQNHCGNPETHFSSYRNFLGHSGLYDVGCHAFDRSPFCILLVAYVYISRINCFLHHSFFYRYSIFVHRVNSLGCTADMGFWLRCFTFVRTYCIQFTFVCFWPANLSCICPLMLAFVNLS